MGLSGGGGFSTGNQLSAGSGLSSGSGLSIFSFLLTGRVDVFAAYSLQRLSGSYGGPLARLRRITDNAEMDFSAAGNGFISFNAVSAWAGGSSNAAVKTVYDQGGGGHDLTQGTAGLQPLIIQAANNLPAVLFDGVSNVMKTAGYTLSQPLSFNTVYRRVAMVTADTRPVFDGLTSFSVNLYRDGASPGDNIMWAGGIGPKSDNGVSQPVGIRGAVAGTYSNTASRMEVNAMTIASFTGTTSTNSMDGLTLGANGGSNTALSNVEVQALVLFNAAHGQAQLQADNASMRATWGF